MPRRRGRWTWPVSGSSSPARIFMKVDLPAPFGPVRPNRRPGANVTFTSSNSFLGPKALVTSWTEIMAGADVTQVGGFREGSVVCFRHGPRPRRHPAPGHPAGEAAALAGGHAPDAGALARARGGRVGDAPPRHHDPGGARGLPGVPAEPRRHRGG